MLLPSMAIFLLLIFNIRCELINDPTIKPTKDFSAKKDAEAVQAGDSKHIAQIVFHRTYDERKKIEDYYNRNMGSRSDVTFMGGLKASSANSLQHLFELLLQPAEEILADSLHNNIHPAKNDPEVGAIEEIVCANDKPMKDLISKQYQTKYGKTVEDELSGFRSDDQVYQDVMHKYCWKGLCQDKKITPEDVDKEAQDLRNISPKKKKTEFKNKLIELLDKYCEPDLKQIFIKYRKGDDDGIDDAVGRAFEVKRQRRAYYYLVRAIEDICQLYAFQLRHAADDAGNIHTDKINRIVMSRCERDLFCIAKAYHDKGYATFTSRLSFKMGLQEHVSAGPDESLYTESIRYLLGKP